MLIKNIESKYCLIFLFLFGFDGVLAIFQGAATLVGIGIPLSIPFRIFEGIYSFSILIFAIIQIAISFAKKWKWSARITGIYVILYTILSVIIGLIFGLISALSGIAPLETGDFILRTNFLNLYIIVVGVIQIILFLWSFKDLSKGIYISPSKN